MNQLGKIIWDIFDSYWMPVFTILVVGGHVAIFSCLYLWHNTLLYIFTPLVMLILSNMISRNFHNKKTAIISMTTINIIVILLSCTFFVEMRETWEYLDEPLVNEYFMSSKLCYCISMFILMILSIRFASLFALVCPKCGIWNDAEVDAKVVKGITRTWIKYTCKCNKCKKIWEL